MGGPPPTQPLSQLSIVDQPFQVVLRSVADLAVSAVSGCDGAGVTLADDADGVAGASSGEAAQALDASQEETEEGPCVTSLRSGASEQFDAANDGDRWPVFAAVAGRHGVLSCLALPLALGARTIGVLNLYSGGERAFGELARAAASTLAHQASVLVANALAYAEARRSVEELRLALSEPEDMVAQAVGILMARHGLSAQVAAAWLEDGASEQGRSMEDLAREVVGSAV